MQWVESDRAALASRVQQLLKVGQFEKGVLLVREAERRGVDCMVAWNVLLQDELRFGTSETAFRLFNDVSFFFLPSIYV